MMSGISVLIAAAPAHAAASWAEEPVVVAHDKLRFNLVHRIHGHPDHYEQTGSTEIEVHSYSRCQPRGQRVGAKKIINRRTDKRNVLELKSLEQELGQQRNECEIDRAHGRQPGEYFVQMI